MESATKTGLRDGEQAWTIGDYLTAAVVDAVRAGNWQRAGGKGRKPKPLPRPGKHKTERVGPSKPKGLTIEQLKARLAEPWRDSSSEQIVDDDGR